MSQEFIKLEQDDDIVMLGKDVFTVARLKELLSENIIQMMNKRPSHNIPSIAGLFYNRELLITDKSIIFNLSNFALVFPPDGLECKFFNLNSKEWINIKLRVISTVNLGRSENPESLIKKIKVDLEYSYPDHDQIKDHNTDESLDDLRAKLNQINPS